MHKRTGLNRRRFVMIAVALGLLPRSGEAKQSPKKVRRKMRRRASKKQSRQLSEASRRAQERVEQCRARIPGHMACYHDAYRCCDALGAFDVEQAQQLYCACLARIADPYCLQCSSFITNEPPPPPMPPPLPPPPAPPA